MKESIYNKYGQAYHTLITKTKNNPKVNIKSTSIFPQQPANKLHPKLESTIRLMPDCSISTNNIKIKQTKTMPLHNKQYIDNIYVLRRWQ